MATAHVLVIPFPAQGHVNPMMLLSRKLVKYGFKINFVIIHERVEGALDSLVDSNINLVSIPDGLGAEDDRNDLGKLCETILHTMPEKLEELINNINASNGDHKISCIVADAGMGWAIEVGNKMGIKGAVFWSAAAASLALQVSIPSLIDDGIIDSDGIPTQKQVIQPLPGMPAMDTAYISWYRIGDSACQKIFFKYTQQYMQTLKFADWWLCNTVPELEPVTFSLAPKLLPIGPLMSSKHTEDSVGQFWQVDHSCLNWLDQQQPCSVVYVAFGSFTVFDPTQFKELALGLELTNRPFLWVVRPDILDQSRNAYPKEFQGTRGKIIGWAPQTKVLNHPAIACFISHCGWNSLIEGVSNGVPFLCWPYFADQFLDRIYICDVWKVGLGFELDENGIVLREEVKRRVDQLFGDESIRARSLELKKMLTNNIADNGQSSKNFNYFIQWLKA
ncbi:hypothetical protein SO802_001806 [Lithocarpus litseifolius]|uniref:UDP-glycosyltransferase 83A1 n=1 Tax=Lithocarpus litseifolius TaxID=425828 RepID=A0AAW2DVF0_9ROSI